MQHQCICFALAGEWYLHDVATVREIIAWEEPCPVPGDSAASLGMLNIRASVVNIFSARALLSLPQAEPGEGTKIIIFESGNLNYGMVVDDVAEIVVMDTEEIDHPQEKMHHRMIQGTFNCNGKLLIIIDFDLCDEIKENDNL